MYERERRYPTSRSVELLYKERVHPAMAVNISPGGICLFGVGGLPLGAQVTVRCLEVAIEAQITWSGDLLTGMRFVAPLGAADLRLFQSTAEAQPQELA